MAVAEEPPFHDASHDVEDDEQLDVPLPRNLASVVVPKEARRRTADAVCRLDSEDFELPKVSPLHFRVSHPSRRV